MTPVIWKLKQVQGFFFFFLFCPLFIHSPHSVCPARWNRHQTPQATKWGGERRAGDPQQKESAEPPLWHHRRAVLAGAPGHPGGRQLLVASLPLQEEKHWTGTEPTTLVVVEEDVTPPWLCLWLLQKLFWLLKAPTRLSRRENICVFYLLIIMCYDRPRPYRVLPCFRCVMMRRLCSEKQVLWWPCCRGEVMSTVRLHPLSYLPPSCPLYPQVAHPEKDSHLISWMAFIILPSYDLSMFYISLLALVLCQICFCTYKWPYVNYRVFKLLFFLSILPNCDLRGIERHSDHHSNQDTMCGVSDQTGNTSSSAWMAWPCSAARSQFRDVNGFTSLHCHQY